MLGDKESGRLTLRQFRSLYQVYKDTFDLELLMLLSHNTYASLKAKAEKDDEWF